MTTDPQSSFESQDAALAPMGHRVLVFGLLGIALGIAPAILFLIDLVPLPRPWGVVGPILWACLIGVPATKRWSAALHERIDQVKELTEHQTDRAQPFPGRLPWIPAWIGVFERGMYCLLLGAQVPGAAAFIGAWIALKVAGGWQIWSKGTTYGRAIFFAGLLGNMMSLLFGVVGGALMAASIPSHCT